MLKLPKGLALSKSTPIYIILLSSGIPSPIGKKNNSLFCFANDKKIKEILYDLNTHDVHNIAERGEKIRNLIKNTPIPPELEQDIKKHYQEMENRYEKNVDVAVRSSATAEDLPDASFAGQQETYLNVRGEEELLEKTRECFASLFTNRAISYRTDKGFDHFSVYLSVGVQKMIRSDLASSGVILSSLLLISIGVKRFSSSKNLDGFSNLISFCFALQ